MDDIHDHEPASRAGAQQPENPAIRSEMTQQDQAQTRGDQSQAQDPVGQRDPGQAETYTTTEASPGAIDPGAQAGVATAQDSSDFEDENGSQDDEQFDDDDVMDAASAAGPAI